MENWLALTSIFRFLFQDGTSCHFGKESYLEKLKYDYIMQDMLVDLSLTAQET